MSFPSSLHSFFNDFRYQGDESNYSLFGSAGGSTNVETVTIGGVTVQKYINEFWTSRQRQAGSIHEISYRACFKPQLPRFFIELLTDASDRVYDPFSGRGTTALEAGLLGRRVLANDINPLSKSLTRPRFDPPGIDKVRDRLSSVRIDETLESDIDLSMFFHPKTLQEILSIRQYLHNRVCNGEDDNVDRWIAMVATNRLTGHSSGFFSVYTLPPNQAVSPESQVKINEQRNQTPGYRSTTEIIIRKTKTLLRNVTDGQMKNLRLSGESAMFLNCEASCTPAIASDSVALTVTSPPFLNIVQYSKDNWMRCWFNFLDAQEISKHITMARTVEEWSAAMGPVFVELHRITKRGGWVAFEVGEVKNRTVKLDEYVVPLGLEAGFECRGILINSQEFSKTSNIWGVKNMKSGTNTNRIVLFHKAG